MSVVKHYFPGGNTSKGFVNYFEGIIAPWVQNNRIYVLKGGPGVGKNTFMKALGKQAEERDYDVEYFHCASDSESLDAIHIPKLGVTMLDGTAPHVIDPVTPGAVDGILNLGVYLDEKGLAEKKERILQLNQENSRGYKRTFSYLAAAGKLQENTNYFYECAINYDELRSEVQDLFGTHELRIGKHNGQVRRLFAEAITPQGFLDYVNTIVTKETIVVLHGPEIVAAEYIRLALHFAMFMGYGCEVYYSALIPDIPKHLIIRDLNLCITTSLDFPKQIEKIVDLTYLLNADWTDKYKDTFEFNELYCKQLQDAAIESLKQTKEIHDDIEKVYAGYMDFEKASAYTKEFLDHFFE